MSKYPVDAAAPKRPIGTATPPLIPFKSSTALLLLDCQYGYRHPTAWGNGLSNPNFESNVQKLIEAFRSRAEGKPEAACGIIIHTQLRPPWSDSPMYLTHSGPYGIHGEQRRGIDWAEYATPRVNSKDGPMFLHVFDEPGWPTPENPEGQVRKEGIVDAKSSSPSREIIMTKHGHGSFINTPLKSLLVDKGIRTLLVAGMTTDQVVHMTVQTAFNMALVGQWGGTGNMIDADASTRWTDGTSWYVEAKEGEAEEDPQLNGFAVNMPRIILIGDATRAFGKGNFDGTTVHDICLESLKPYAEVRNTVEVIEALN